VLPGIQDKYPASPGHLLLIPFRHAPTLFDATDAELAALIALAREAKTLLDDRFHPDGYNVGANVGAAAGQTVMHLHIHVIPRYAGDVADPRGGVRGAIPEKRISPALAHHYIYRFSLPSLIIR